MAFSRSHLKGGDICQRKQLVFLSQWMRSNGAQLNLESFKNPVPPAQDLGKEAFLKLLTVTCLGIVDTPRGSIFCRYRRCVYERSRNFTSGKAV